MTRHLTALRGTCLLDPAELRIKTGSEQITPPDVLWHWKGTADDNGQHSSVCWNTRDFVFLIKHVVNWFVQETK